MLTNFSLFLLLQGQKLVVENSCYSQTADSAEHVYKAKDSRVYRLGQQEILQANAGGLRQRSLAVRYNRIFDVMSKKART